MFDQESHHEPVVEVDFTLRQIDWIIGLLKNHIKEWNELSGDMLIEDGKIDKLEKADYAIQMKQALTELEHAKKEWLEENDWE